MKLTIDTGRVDWWFWTITLAGIMIALAGWTPAYGMVMGLSFFQIIYFTRHERSIIAFPTQVRIAYFLLTLFGLWPAIRSYPYAILFMGTLMVVLFDRCAIALVLQKMPWNRNLPNPHCKLR